MIRQFLIAAVIAVGAASCQAQTTAETTARTATQAITLTPAEQKERDTLAQPEAWFAANLKGPREVANGVELDVRLQWVLENVTRPNSAPAVQTYLRGVYTTQVGRDATRAALDRYWLLHTVDTPPLPTEDRTINGRDGTQVPIRIYRPEGGSDLPILVYYHGGGFMFGSLDGWDRTVRLIAHEAKAIVISVGYRLSPESPYPAAWNDAEDAYLWALAHEGELGGSGVSLGGDSAGGTLAIATALRAHAAHKPMPVALLLYYPGVDREGSYPSMTAFGSGYGLDADNLKYLADQVYPAGVTTTAADTSPMQADLCALPNTAVFLAGFDPLKDSQDAFVKVSPVACDPFHGRSMTVYSSLIHGFLQTTAYVPAAEAAARTSAQSFGMVMRAGTAAGPSPTQP